MTLEEAIIAACGRAKGAYSLLILANNKLFAIKDPNGFRTLALGRVGDSYVLASETCAFDLLEAEPPDPRGIWPNRAMRYSAMTNMAIRPSTRRCKSAACAACSCMPGA